MGNKRRCFVSKLNYHTLFEEFQLRILAYEAILISTVQSSLPPFYELKFRLSTLKYGGGENLLLYSNALSPFSVCYVFGRHKDVCTSPVRSIMTKSRAVRNRNRCS